MTEIGRTIREARQAQGMTIKELADAADVDEATVGRIERGKTKSPSSLDKLHRALHIGVYQQPEAPTADHDPRLSEATFGDLLAALAAKHYGGRPATDATRTQRQGPNPSGLVIPRWDGSVHDGDETG